MSNENKTSTPTEGDPGLPPVSPPSGRFILQLFLVPGLIVLIAVGGWLLFQWLFGSSLSAEEFIRELNHPNAENRWRAAADLSQTLPRDKELASDPQFALSLAERLDKSREEIARIEKQWQDEVNEKGRANASSDLRRQIVGERDFLLFIIACLGKTMIPTGADVLAEIAEKDETVNEKSEVYRRQQAVLALGVLGGNVRSFHTVLEPERKQQVLAALKGVAEEDKESPERRARAELALKILTEAERGAPSAEKVTQALQSAAEDEYPPIRHMAALALGFWRGPGVEAALIDLARDTQGRGLQKYLNLVSRDDVSEKPRPEEQEKIRDTLKLKTDEQYARVIRYQAVAGLARLGSERVMDFAEVLREMLDEEELRKFAATVTDKEGNPDEGLVQSTIAGAARAVAALHKHKPKLAARFKKDLETLAEHSNATIRGEAQEALRVLASN